MNRIHKLSFSRFYTQRNNYVLDIYIKDNNKSYYDNNVELYNFDTNKEVISKKPNDATTSMYFENRLKYLPGRLYGINGE